jgi:hypothetical protein
MSRRVPNLVREFRTVARLPRNSSTWFKGRTRLSSCSEPGSLLTRFESFELSQTNQIRDWPLHRWTPNLRVWWEGSLFGADLRSSRPARRHGSPGPASRVSMNVHRGRSRKLSIRAGCLSLVALLAISCGSAARRSGTPAAPRGPRQCQRSDVAVSFVRDLGVALGNRDGTLVVRNRSHRACAVRGYPTLRLEDAHHTPRTTRVDRGPTYFQLDRGPRVVVLVPGARAVANVAWTIEPRPDEPQRTVCEPISPWIDVTVPGQRVASRLPFNESPCDHGHLFTTALRAAHQS